MKKYGLFGVVCGLIFLAFLMKTHAQEKYPTRQIELVVPLAPGGSADITARLFSEELARVLKVPVTVVNRAGGSGIQGTTYVALAKKDGYTLLNCGGGLFTFLPFISQDVKYSLKDFIPLAQFAYVTTVFCVRSDSPIKTLKDLIEYARKNPGKLKCAGFPGSESMFNLKIFSTMHNIEFTSIPYQSGGEGVVALLGGHIDFSASTHSTYGPQIKAGKFRGLAVTSKTRLPGLPDIPSTSELGYPDGTFILIRFGAFAPAGVPQSVLDVLIPAIEKTFKNPETVDRAKKLDFIVEYEGPEEFRKILESETQNFKKIIEQQAGKK